LSTPFHFVKFRVTDIQWHLNQQNEYTCTVKGRAYNKKFFWLKSFPCTHEDLLKHTLQSGCVLTICVITKLPVSIVKSQYKSTNSPQLPSECVIEDGRVRLPKDMRTVLEICNFFNRAAVHLSKQMCYSQYTHAGTKTIEDWLTLKKPDVFEWAEEWEVFFNERQSCFDQTALMHASNCFEGFGKMKLGLIAQAVTRTLDDDLFQLCAFELCSTPGLQPNDIMRARSCWVHYMAFLKRHNIETLQFEFSVLPIEQED